MHPCRSCSMRASLHHGAGQHTVAPPACPPPPLPCAPQAQTQTSSTTMQPKMLPQGAHTCGKQAAALTTVVARRQLSSACMHTHLNSCCGSEQTAANEARRCTAPTMLLHRLCSPYCGHNAACTYAHHPQHPGTGSPARPTTTCPTGWVTTAAQKALSHVSVVHSRPLAALATSLDWCPPAAVNASAGGVSKSHSHQPPPSVPPRWNCSMLDAG
jgi:hypothetical protein